MINCIYTLGWEEGGKKAKHPPAQKYPAVRYLFSVPSSPAKANGRSGVKGDLTSRSSPPPPPRQKLCPAAPCSPPRKAVGTRAPLLPLHGGVGGHKTVTGRSCSSCVSKAIRSLWTSFSCCWSSLFNLASTALASLFFRIAV